jgi:peptidyl-prolyl cis-trans isomerase D
MSALQYLREKAGPLVAIVIGVALVLFVVSDFFGKGRGQRMRQREYYEIGKIGKNTVSYPEYETRVQDVIEIYKLSGREVDEATHNQVREQIWQQMIRETILDSKYEKLGIRVSDEELDELVFGNNPHNIVRQLFTDQQTGFFNSSFLVNFLKQTEIDETAKRYWLFFENEIIIDRTSSKYNALVSKGLYVTSKQAEFEKALLANSVDFSYIMKNYSSVPDADVTITDREVSAYFEKHKENYKRTAQRDIEYVIFEVTPSEDDIQETEKWITTTKEDFSRSTEPVQFINITSDVRHIDFFYPLSSVPEALVDFVKQENLNNIFGPYLENGSFKIARLLAVEERPDSVRVRHILMSPNQFMPLEGVRHIADSLAQVLRSRRASFDEFAMMYSEDYGSAQIGGDLGWFSEGVMIPPFNNACFTGRKGEIKTVETNFGIHIIEILDVSRRTKKYDIGFVERRVIASSQTNQMIYNEVSLFAGASNTYEKFNNTIAEKQLNKRIASNVIPQQRTLPGIENPRPIIMALQQTKKDKIVLDNNQQAIFELGDSYVVAYCTRVQEDGYATVADVDIEIRIALMKDKKAEIISDEFKKNMTGGNLYSIASALNLYAQDASQVNFRSYIIEGLGIEPALAATAPEAALDVVSGPVKGENGVFLFTVNSSTPSAEEDIDAIKLRLTSMAQFRSSYDIFEALQKDAKIVDKRYKFY